eukprot:3587368-Alexandrium_andersonii.AAC.1
MPCGPQQARRAKRPCPTLGSRRWSATPSVAALGAPGAQCRNLGVADVRRSRARGKDVSPSGPAGGQRPL